MSSFHLSAALGRCLPCLSLTLTLLSSVAKYPIVRIVRFQYYRYYLTIYSFIFFYSCFLKEHEILKK